MALNVGPSAGMMGKVGFGRGGRFGAPQGQGVGLTRPRPVPIDQGGTLPPPNPGMPINLPPMQNPGITPGITPPMPARPPGMIMDGSGVLPNAGTNLPLPTPAPMPGPIDTGPNYTNPYQTNVPDMAFGQTIGQNIRKAGGLRGAYGGAAAGLQGGPFRRQMFY